MKTRLRIGRAVCKTEGEAAQHLMEILKRTHPDVPPAMATDARGSYREALVETWGKVPEYRGFGRPAGKKRAQEGWQYLQVQKVHSGSRLVEVRVHVVHGDPEQVRALLGEHTAYIERSHLTSRQMNGRVVRKTLSYSKKLECLRAACTLEDAAYNWTRTNRSLRVQSETPGRKWDQRTPAMAAGLADHRWSFQELLSYVAPPVVNNAD